VHGDGFDEPLRVDNDMEDKITDTNPNIHYAVQLVHATCCLAGSASYLDDIRADLRACGIIRAIKDHDTPALFDWLVEMLSYQGISDSVAAGYIAQHGNVRWADVADELSRTPSCPKLGGYWRFTGCRYHKGSGTCAEPSHIDACQLPRHPLRNGRLNQMAYSLFLFIRDVADNDFVGWIDSQLGTVNSQTPDRLAALREAIIGPLRNVYGVSDKVLAMALHRTGILQRFGADHPYGDRCYRPDGCAGILRLLPANIDAREFNLTFPKTFPRFVQSAVWRYCAENGLDVCNGNRIDDNAPCDNRHCQLFRRCDRIALRAEIQENNAKSII
jgi:hypothetical protein